MDKGCFLSRDIADVGQIHLKMGRERLAHFNMEKRRGADLSTPGMARLLPQILQHGVLKSFALVKDFAHSIVLSERGNGVSDILFRLHHDVHGMYNDRQCWPHVQRLRVGQS